MFSLLLHFHISLTPQSPAHSNVSFVFVSPPQHLLHNMKSLTRISLRCAADQSVSAISVSEARPCVRISRTDTSDTLHKPWWLRSRTPVYLMKYLMYKLCTGFAHGARGNFTASAFIVRLLSRLWHCWSPDGKLSTIADWSADARIEVGVEVRSLCIGVLWTCANTALFMLFVCGDLCGLKRCGWRFVFRSVYSGNKHTRIYIRLCLTESCETSYGIIYLT